MMGYLAALGQWLFTTLGYRQPELPAQLDCTENVCRY